MCMEKRLTRAQSRQKRKIDTIKRNRDFIAAWSMATLKTLEDGIGRLSPLEKQLLRIEEKALDQLAAVLHTRALLAESQSRDQNGEMVLEDSDSERRFVLSPKALSKGSRKGGK